MRAIALAALAALLGCSVAIGLDAGKPEVCEPGAVIACYTGPTATKDVGACKSGTKTCNADGSGYGACRGEVVPMADACESPGVGSCDGKACSAALWALDIGQAYPPLIAVDPSGDVFVAGAFPAMLDLGHTPLSSESSANVYLAKLDVAGDVQWAQDLGGPQVFTLIGLAAGPDGGVVLAGSFTGSGPAHVGKNDVDPGIFLAKFDSTGAPVWSEGIGGMSSSLTSIAIDDTNDVLLAGSVGDSINLGGGDICTRNCGRGRPDHPGAPPRGPLALDLHQCPSSPLGFTPPCRFPSFMASCGETALPGPRPRRPRAQHRRGTRDLVPRRP